MLKANSLWALTQYIQQIAAALRPDARQKALAYQYYFDHSVALVTGRLKDLPTSQHVSLYHSMGNPLTTTGGPPLNRDWIDLAGGKNTAENWFSEHQQNHSSEVALEKIVTVNPAVIIAMNKCGVDAVLSFPQWASVDVIIYHRAYASSKGTFWWCRETSEEVLQSLRLVKALYPARLADVDIRKETRESYRQFFDLTLSDAQVSDVLGSPR